MANGFKTVAKVAPPTPEENIAPAVLKLLQDYFTTRGEDLKPFCSSSGGVIMRIKSVREGKGKVNAQGVGFADATLYVNLAFYQKYKDRPAEFVSKVMDAICARQPEQKAMLSSLKSRLASSKTIDPQSVPKKSDERVELEGGVNAPRWMHELYARLEYGKATPVPSDLTLQANPGLLLQYVPRPLRWLYSPTLAPAPIPAAPVQNHTGIFLNEQAFIAGYTAYLRGLKEKTIQPGLFLIADFNLRNTHRRFYVVDFTDAAHPRVLDAFEVAHGKQSDDGHGYVARLSNEIDSHESSEGLYRIAWGGCAGGHDKKYGFFWRVEGCDSTSSKAFPRGILIHRKRGDYTWGCFGIDPLEASRQHFPLGDDVQPSKPEVEKWTGVGVFVYFNPMVREAAKKYWDKP